MASPVRIQRRRTRGWRLPPGAIYVGRPSRWGNPWRPTTRGLVLGRRAAMQVVRAFRRDLPPTDQMSVWLEPLRGRDLACWCGLCEAHRDGLPLGVECPDCAPCHADVLLELANRG